MKIVHLCLSCFYIDGYSYQENELVRDHVSAGHDVVVIASTETYDNNQKRVYVKPSQYIGQEGAKVVRLPYSKLLPHFFMKKMRLHPNVYAFLEQEAPEVILFHGLCGWELYTAARYKKAHPEIKFYVDCHEDANNSAKNLISKVVLHKLFYRSIIHRSLSSIQKVLCISMESMEFCQSLYGVPKDKLEFYPLGGKVFNEQEYYERREGAREKYQIGEDHVLFLQTGKMDSKKKLLVSLRSFLKTTNPGLRFIIVGSIADEIKRDAEILIGRDSRTRFIGWKNVAELQDLLCAADVYIQPGSQSATMQMSLCARCPVVLDDVLSHRVFVKGNGWLVKNEQMLNVAFEDIDANPSILKKMSSQSLAIAKDLLDYNLLSKRVLR